MARSTVLEDLNTVVNLGVSKDPLILPILNPPVIGVASSNYHGYATSASVMADGWSEAIERFNLDWAGLLVDDLFQYEPLGISVTDNPALPFGVTKYLPATAETLSNLRIPNPRKDGRMPVLLEAERRLRDRWGKDILICGSSTAAPFSGLTLVYGVEQTMLLLYDNPFFLQETTKFLEELTIVWGKAMIESGADLIWLGDCGASSRFISPNVYREYCLEPARRVTAELKAAGAKVIYHAGENNLAFLKMMVDVGADILSVEGGIDMKTVKDEIGNKVCLIGNIDSINLLWRGTPETIKNHVQRLVREIAVKGGYIVSCGEGIPVQTPAENFESMVKSIRESWKKWVNTKQPC